MPAEIENTAAYKQIFEDANQKMEQIISQRKPTWSLIQKKSSWSNQKDLYVALTLLNN